MIEMDIDNLIRDFEVVMPCVEAGELITILINGLTNGAARAALMPFAPLGETVQGMRA